MTQVTLDQVPEALGPVFEAGDPASAAKEREREHVAIISEMFRAIAAGRCEEMRRHLAPDVTLQIVAPRRAPWVRRAEGADEMIAAVEKNFRATHDQRPEPLALVAQGDTVMVMGRETGRWADDDEPYEVLLAQQFTFRDGRLVCFRSVAGEVDDA
jgi:ketosteroid isomerase-like protein